MVTTMKKTLIMTLCLGWGLTSIIAQTTSSQNEAIQRAINALRGTNRKTDPQQAFKFLKEEAFQGNPNATHAVGMAYLTGAGVERDTEKALMYLTEAANLGHINAWINIGHIYQNGDGVPQNYQEALRCYHLAIENQCYSALYPAACLYYYGLGTPRNHDKAFEYFTQSAEMGQAESMYMLGLCYEYGHGTPINGQQAYTWMEAARVHGIQAAKLELKKNLLSLTPQDSTPSESMNLSAYPNPFSETLTLTFDLPEKSSVIISLSNFTLNQTFKTTTEILPAGKQQITINPGDITPGMYVLQISVKYINDNITILKK